VYVQNLHCGKIEWMLLFWTIPAVTSNNCSIFYLIYLLKTVAGTVDTSLLNVPPQIRSVQVGSILGARPELAAHGMIIQSPLHELGPTEPTIEVT
jgi:hypothetical protein